ncbi:hypothetical protein LMG23992_02496 [Cupriavidus laharis]|uniref:Uncharacterized protein n=1 Tax=Cupriavidus laharis TaxID=151654 RepID=A0ABN7YP30_9BURK|nr:hypothetical protein [Cupriavidus laharis]CAG9173602.1 hypothetical protein LMG23992_02496 [Cupriavidus laharis]
MQTILSVLAITILIVTAVGLVSPTFISQTFLQGKPVGRLQIAVIGLSLAALLLILVGRLAQPAAGA